MIKEVLHQYCNVTAQINLKEVLHQYCNVTAQINLKCYMNAQGKKHFLVYYV